MLISPNNKYIMKDRVPMQNEKETRNWQIKHTLTFSYLIKEGRYVKIISSCILLNGYILYIRTYTIIFIYLFFLGVGGCLTHGLFVFRLSIFFSISN